MIRVVGTSSSRVYRHNACSDVVRSMPLFASGIHFRSGHFFVDDREKSKVSYDTELRRQFGSLSFMAANTCSKRMILHSSLSAKHMPMLLAMNSPLVNVTSRSFSSRRQSPYQVLNVSPSATAKEIKLAYYHLAKKYHPDLHRDKPFDEQLAMKKKFQDVSAAYEYLNTVREGGQATWDSGGTSGGGSSGSYSSSQQQQEQQHYYSHANPEDIFNSVLQDSEVLTEVFGMLLTDMQAEFGMAVEAAKVGDFDYLWEIAKANKGIIFGVVIPTTLIIRFPAMLPLVARWVMYAAQTAFVGLLQSGRTKELSGMLWSQIIRNSEMQISYYHLKEKKRQEKLNEYQQKDKDKANKDHGEKHEKEGEVKGKDRGETGTSTGTGTGTGRGTTTTTTKKRERVGGFSFKWKSKT